MTEKIAAGAIIGEAYGGVRSRELLLVCGDDGAATLGGVQCALALDNRLAGSGGTTASAATDLGDGVPVVRHVVCVLVCREKGCRVRRVSDDLKAG